MSLPVAQFSARPDAEIVVGLVEPRGHERCDTLIPISIRGAKRYQSNGDFEPEAYEVLVWLTVPQVAEIVKGYFADVISPRNIFTSLLERLLRHRRAVMTENIAKEPLFPGDTRVMPRYSRVA